ncbi:phage tail protein [Nostoc sp. FACHB-133]|uniref:phage tail protein n=1 Tax=Nostoc sp. FACHB-133 TaxID=2692835 RepID=UPI0016847132|nr:phage tail protein [Nostoc sp. FACHB-133]MBD2526804.1 phage tail protein [Nostoc sp. FACHB-133]
MADLKPIPSSRFYVEFDGVTQKLLKNVAEMNFTGQTVGHEKPLKQNPNFTINVYLAEGDMDFYNWMKATMPESEGGDGKWAENRKGGAIVAYDSSDTEVMRWKITKAWIKSYKVSEFSAESNELAVETFEIVCEQIDRTK